VTLSANDLSVLPDTTSIKRSDIERMIDYIRTQERRMTTEGAYMTVIEAGLRPVRTPVYCSNDRVLHRPRHTGGMRPAGAAMAYRGTAVRMSRVPHRPRPASVTTTVCLAAVTALITVWLAALAQSRATDTSGTSLPERTAVVQVLPGENLQRLAARVAPDAPVGNVVDRIKELNKLDSAALDAGQTLIAPVG
jgi:LysM domain